MSRRHLALALIATLPAGCASLGPGAPVSVATADGATRYEGARSGTDQVRLRASGGADCAGDLRPTTETATGAPADFGAILCEDGVSGILLFSGGAGAAGGAVSGVMARRSVSGRWGAGSVAGPGAGV